MRIGVCLFLLLYSLYSLDLLRPCRYNKKPLNMCIAEELVFDACPAESLVEVRINLFIKRNPSRSEEKMRHER